VIGVKIIDYLPNLMEKKMAISQVVAIQTNGNPYDTVPPNATASGAGGNGGSVAKASNTNLLDGVEVSRYDAGVFGSAVVDTNDIDKVYSSGALAYNNPGPISKRVTTNINGSANTFLLSGALVPNLIHSIHYQKVKNGSSYVQGVRTRRFTSAIRENKWNDYTGKFESGYPVVSVDVFADDNAALPTRSVPGNLTFMSSGSNVVNDTYKEKTG
jgi:hypothetical protein